MRNEFVARLKHEAGYHEGRNADGTWNNHQKYSLEVPELRWSDGQPWCAVFTTWGAMKAGMTDRWPVTASCWNAVRWWKAQHRWTEYPVLGGPFYMGDAGEDHVGVVTAYDGDWIWTIEGNTNLSGGYQGDGVYERKRPRRGPGSPYGYGVPDYPEGTISADPALGGVPRAMVAVPMVPFPGRDKFGPGKVNDWIQLLGEQLVAKGYGRHYSVGPTPDWGNADKLNVQDFQHAQGWTGNDADGYPGPETWRRLFS